MRSCKQNSFVKNHCGERKVHHTTMKQEKKLTSKKIKGILFCINLILYNGIVALLEFCLKMSYVDTNKNIYVYMQPFISTWHLSFLCYIWIYFFALFFIGAFSCSHGSFSVAMVRMQSLWQLLWLYYNIICSFIISTFRLFHSIFCWFVMMMKI